ncbi:MAG: Maf family protein [Steroidobacteraceae bacterium]|jgi:septum formation protein
MAAVSPLVLASASPRRSALLSQLGLRHRVVPAHIDEQRLEGESIEQCVRRLAMQKALQVSAMLAAAEPMAPPAAVLGADTTVVIEEQMLGKPRDREHALAMLERLSGHEHEVLSAVALVCAGTVNLALSRSWVRLRALAREECEAYWDSGEPRDKAGGYAIQGRGAVFVEALRGSYSGVMGLPLFETGQLLAAAGLPLWQI